MIAFTALLLLTPLLTTKPAGCATVAHVPAADVEYHEGADSKGYAVTPADLTPPVLSKEDFRHLPVPINIPLKNYPAQKPDFAKTEAEWKQDQKAKQDAEGKKPGTPTYNADTSESWVQPGLVTVDTQKGNVALDGKDLRPPEPAELNPDCWK